MARGVSFPPAKILKQSGSGPWISRMRPIQIHAATRSPLLCRCPARNLRSGSISPEREEHLDLACRVWAHAAAAAPPSSVMGRAVVQSIRHEKTGQRFDIKLRVPKRLIAPPTILTTAQWSQTA